MSEFHKTLLESIIPVAREAGALIMSHYTDGTQTRHKSDRSPVTDADEDAERLILDRLKAIAPGIPVIAEEQAAAGNLPTIGNQFFLVDPLDGTREFLDRNGEFTVNIALIENTAPMLGVVYAPAVDRLFAGSVPGTAVEWHGGHMRSIAARKPPHDGITAVASRSHRDKHTDEFLKHYPIGKFVSAGSSLKFCMIAAGEADIYPRHGRTMEWDTAAGHAVLSAAGGRVTTLDGHTPLTYGKRAEGFANPHFVAWGAIM